VELSHIFSVFVKSSLVLSRSLLWDQLCEAWMVRGTRAGLDDLLGFITKLFGEP